MALEMRAPLEMLTTAALWPLLTSKPRGDGHPVLVFPGLAASDHSTVVLRRFLRAHGYSAYPSDMGRNLGPRPGVMEACLRRIDELRAHHGRKVSLIGWSLGGLFARELAKLRPNDVRLVVSLGSPFAGPSNASNASGLYGWLNRDRRDDPAMVKQLHIAPPVPTTSIYSRSDGVVAWQCSVQDKHPHTENIEVAASHTGLGASAWALHAIADRLAQPEGAWQPFSRLGWRQWMFRNPHA